MRILSYLCLAFFLHACAAGYTRPQVQIDGFETAPGLKRPKSRSFGTNLNLNDKQIDFLIAGEQSELIIVEEGYQADDLAKLLELEIATYRNPNDYSLLKEMMDYADDSRDPAMAERALEVATNLHRNEYALRAAELWVQIDPNSQKAQDAYIYELITQSQHSAAFDFMARRYERGQVADFRPIAGFLTPLSEKQMRSLIFTYDSYIKTYPAISDNLIAGRQIARYKLAELLFYNDKIPESLRAINFILANKKVTTNLRKAAVTLKARIYYLTQQPGGEAFYDAEIKKDRDNFILPVYYALYLTNTQRTAQAENMLSALLKPDIDEPKAYLLAIFAQDRSLPKLRSATQSYYKKLARKDDLGYIRLGLLAMSRQDYTLAEEFLFGAKGEDFSRWEQSRWLLLKSALETKEFNKIEGIMEEVYQKDRNLYSYIVGRYSYELASAGQKKAAKDVIRVAENLLPLKKDLLLAKAYMHYELGETKQMTKVFDRLIKTDDADPRSLNGYGYALADKNIQVNKAINLIKQALDIEPGNAAYTDSLGWAEYRLGNLDRAQELLNWAYRQNPDSEIAAHLGEVLWKKREYERARYIWLKAYETDPYSAPLLNTLTRFEINPRRLNPNIRIFNPPD